MNPEELSREIEIRAARRRFEEVQEIKDKYGTPVAYDEWRNKFGQYATKSRAFLLMLRRTLPHLMTEPSLAVQLQNLADAFQEQADRFKAASSQHEEPTDGTARQ